MNCYNHPTTTAVAQCIDCKKGLCVDCSEHYAIPICKSCNSLRAKNERANVLKELLITFGTGMLITLIMIKGPLHAISLDYDTYKNILIILLMIYLYSGIAAGWYTLNKITPKVFMALPIVGWILYFFFKMFLSLFVGLFMLPIRTLGNIRKLKKLKVVEVYAMGN